LDPEFDSERQIAELNALLEETKRLKARAGW
jgi:hypothetical protein